MNTLNKTTKKSIDRKNIYSNKQWKEFSKEMIKDLGGQCFKCDRTKNETVLQIHHIVYEKGKLPWESPKEDLEILCKGCHAREHDILEPSDSWILLDIIDNGTANYQCERQKGIDEKCNTEIRYEHTIYHPNVGYRTVGSTCINHLTDADQQISKDTIKEKNSFYDKLTRLENNILPQGWKHKTIKNLKKITTFEKNKKNNKGNYNINAVIFHNDNGNHSLKIEINDKVCNFTNEKTNTKSQYFYNEMLELIDIVLTIEGIMRTKNQNKKHLESFYRDRLKEICNCKITY